jgi:HsdM N-terminal domain
VASTVDTGLPADASREILTLGQLEQHLWGAANILRGPIDQADFKSYIFPLLFFKRICDVYEEEFLDLSRFTREPSLLVFCTPFGFGTAVHRAFPGECRSYRAHFCQVRSVVDGPIWRGSDPRKVPCVASPVIRSRVRYRSVSRGP